MFGWLKSLFYAIKNAIFPPKKEFFKFHERDEILRKEPSAEIDAIKSMKRLRLKLKKEAESKTDDSNSASAPIDEASHPTSLKNSATLTLQALHAKLIKNASSSYFSVSKFLKTNHIIMFDLANLGPEESLSILKNPKLSSHMRNSDKNFFYRKYKNDPGFKAFLAEKEATSEQEVGAQQPLALF